MPAVTINGAAVGSLTYTSADALGVVSALAQQISASVTNGSLVAFNYVGSGDPTVAPGPASGDDGAVTFTQPANISASGQPIAVYVMPTDAVVIDSANGPVSFQGGAPGGTFVAGAGLAGAPRNVTYTNITPGGTATDQIAVLGGNNLIQTSFTGAGHYNVNTGSGNDTINILSGNATVNPGTGWNQVNLGSGHNQIDSEGYDTITGASVGGGNDLVYVGSGQTTINSGTSNFVVGDASPNPLQVMLGTGVDTVDLGGSGVSTLLGVDSQAFASGLGTVVATDSGGVDYYTVTGGANATVVAGAGNVGVDGTGTSGNEMFEAGSGNDTLLAGPGSATLTGAMGGAASAFLQSGSSGPTTFAFTNGQSGGSDTISGFKANDVLSLTGYSANPTISHPTGYTLITLSDGTTIALAGSQPTASQIRMG